MRRIAFGVAAGLTVALAVSAQAADTFVVDPGHSEVSFRVRHFVSQVSGRFNSFEGTIQVDHDDPAASSVSFKIKTDSIDTGNEQRDGHLRSPDFFEAEKYPEITFESSKVEPKGDDLYHVTGAFTLHGVTKELTLPVRYLGSVTDNRGSTKAGFETEVTIDRQEYGITFNRALDQGGVMLGNDVSVRIALEVGPPREPRTN